MNMITCVWRRTVVNDVSLHQRFLFWHLLFGAVADGLRNVSPSCCIGEKMNGYCPKSYETENAVGAMLITRSSIVIYFL